MRATCSDPLGGEGQAESDGMIQVKGRNQDLNTRHVQFQYVMPAALTQLKYTLFWIFVWKQTLLKTLLLLLLQYIRSEFASFYHKESLLD